MKLDASTARSASSSTEVELITGPHCNAGCRYGSLRRNFLESGSLPLSIRRICRCMEMFRLTRSNLFLHLLEWTLTTEQAAELAVAVQNRNDTVIAHCTAVEIAYLRVQSVSEPSLLPHLGMFQPPRLEARVPKANLGASSVALSSVRIRCSQHTIDESRRRSFRPRQDLALPADPVTRYAVHGGRACRENSRGRPVTGHASSRASTRPRRWAEVSWVHSLLASWLTPPTTLNNHS